MAALPLIKITCKGQVFFVSAFQRRKALQDIWMERQPNHFINKLDFVNKPFLDNQVKYVI